MRWGIFDALVMSNEIRSDGWVRVMEAEKAGGEEDLDRKKKKEKPTKKANQPTKNNPHTHEKALNYFKELMVGQCRWATTWEAIGNWWLLKVSHFSPEMCPPRGHQALHHVYTGNTKWTPRALFVWSWEGKGRTGGDGMGWGVDLIKPHFPNGALFAFLFWS